MPATLCNIAEAAAIIQDGGVIAYPTEAVFGLGCDPTNPKALQRLLAIKKRSSDKGLILIASQLVQLAPFINEIDAHTQSLADRYWPGPVTLVIKAKPDINKLLTGGRETLAVRVSSHPVVFDLCEACDQALVSTSANISGQAPSKNQTEVLELLAPHIDGMLEGALGDLDKPTKIIDAQSGDILRG